MILTAAFLLISNLQLGSGYERPSSAWPSKQRCVGRALPADTSGATKNFSKQTRPGTRFPNYFSQSLASWRDLWLF
jgi:hypothetical protein